MDNVIDKTKKLIDSFESSELISKLDYYKRIVIGNKELLDLIKRYGPYDEILDDDYFIDIITEILRQVIYDGKGIEINTSCFKYNLPDLTPSRKIIELYKSLGGEIITTGSDAHATGFLACNFKYIYDIWKVLDLNMYVLLTRWNLCLIKYNNIKLS